jgi:hypothetical protein
VNGERVSPEHVDVLEAERIEPRDIFAKKKRRRARYAAMRRPWVIPIRRVRSRGDGNDGNG